MQASGKAGVELYRIFDPERENSTHPWFSGPPHIPNRKTQKGIVEATGRRPVQSEGNSMGAQENTAQGVSGANNYRTHQVIKMDLTPAEASLVGPAPTASSETSSPVEGTRPLNAEDISASFQRGTIPPGDG